MGTEWLIPKAAVRAIKLQWLLLGVAWFVNSLWAIVPIAVSLCFGIYAGRKIFVNLHVLKEKGEWHKLPPTSSSKIDRA